MYICELNTDCGTVQIPCDTLVQARAEEARCMTTNEDGENILREGVFSVRVYMRCINVETKKNKEGKTVPVFHECNQCGKCQRRTSSSQVDKFKARYAKVSK